MPVLKTERLLLRPLTASDAPAAFAWSGDERVTRFLGYATYASMEDVRRWLESVQNPRPNDPILFGIVRRSDALLIGSISVRRSDGDPATWSFGYCLRHDCWHQGYATEAARAVLRYAHDVHGAMRFQAEHAVENPASGRVIEKCGLRFDHFGAYAKRDGSKVFPSKVYTGDAADMFRP